jgi:large subunit ribosomal protein L35
MARCEASGREMLQGLRKLCMSPSPYRRNGMNRLFSSSTRINEETTSEDTIAKSPSEDATIKTSFRRNPDPQLVSSRRLERKLVKAKNPPIGSRRRRVALQQSEGIPFEQLPYQCFQEARKVIVADREDKIRQIEALRARIIRLRDTSPEQSGGELRKRQILHDLSLKLDHLKILADINDPLVKRRFEDGLGTLNQAPVSLDACHC